MNEGHLEAHPATNLFPMMADDELLGLANDIAAHGLLHPVVLHEDRVLDGRNRLKACELAGVEPTFTTWEPNGTSPAEWVIATNLHRRHLTTSQRGAIAVEALPLLEAEAKERQREHGGTAPGRPKDESGTLPPNWAEVSGEARNIAGEMFGVGHGTVWRAKQVRKHRPDLFEEVKEGKKTVGAALREAGLATPAQRNGTGTEPSMPARVDKSRAATAERRERIAQMAREGYREEAIAEAVGLSVETVRAFYHDMGIPTLSQKIGKTARLKHSEIMERLIDNVTPPESTLRVLYGNWESLDTERFEAWATQLSEAIRTLTQLRNKLRANGRNGRNGHHGD